MDKIALSLLPTEGDDPKKKVAKKTPVPVAADTLITPKGNIVTRAQFDMSAKNGLAFNNMKAMGDYIDGWARPIKEQPTKTSPAIAKAQAIIEPVVKKQAAKKDYYDGYSTPGSGGMRYHQK